MRRVVYACMLAAACGDDGASAVDSPPAPTGLYEPATRFAVDMEDGAITYTTDDLVTPDRTIRLRVRRPVGATGALPVVIVIHGGGFNNGGHMGMADWGVALATAGYFVIHFANADDEPDVHCAPLQIPAEECTVAAAMLEVANGGTLPAPMFTRPNDVRAILDRLDAIAAEAGVSVDPAQIAVLGHSGGSNAVVALAGGVIDVSPSVHLLPVAEPRIRVFVANSPQGIGRLGVTATTWDPITAPILLQTGSNDSTNGEDAASRVDAFAGLDGPDVFQHFVDSSSAVHSTFALESDPGVEGIELTLATTAIAFLDAYLRERAEAQAWLASDALEQATAGVSTLSRK